MRLCLQLLLVLQFKGSLILRDAVAHIVVNFFDEGRNEITVSLFPEQTLSNFILNRRQLDHLIYLEIGYHEFYLTCAKHKIWAFRL